MKKLYTVFMGGMIFVTFLLILCSVFFPTNVFYTTSFIGSIFVMFFIFFLWYLLYHKVISKIILWDKRKKTIFLIFYFLSLFGVQIVCFSQLQVNPSWDFGVIYHNALNYVEKTPIGYLEYFEYCPNNIMLYLIYICIFKFTHFFHISNSMMVLGLFNIILIQLSIYLLFLCARRIFKEKMAYQLLFLVWFLSPFFLYVPIIYTDTTTMFIPLLLIILFLKSQDYEGKKHFGLLLLFSIVAFFGYKLKMSVLILVVALMGYLFLQKKFLELFKYLGVFGVVFLVFSFGYQKCILNNSKFHFQDNGVGSLSYTHYLMMGFEDPTRDNSGRNTFGGYSEEDANFTKSFVDVERKKANLEELKRRFTESDMSYLLYFYGNKIANTWGDGTYFAPLKLGKNPIKDSILHDFVLPNGKYFTFYLLFCQGTQFALLVLLFVSVVKSLKNIEVSYLYLSIFGLFLFLILWETRSRYIVNYVPILLLSIVPGFTCVNDFLEKKIFFKQK